MHIDKNYRNSEYTMKTDNENRILLEKCEENDLGGDNKSRRSLLFLVSMSAQGSKLSHTRGSVFIGHSPVDMLTSLLNHQSSQLFMRGKLRAKHYVRPAHVKAGFKCVNRNCIDNIMYRKAVPGIDNWQKNF